VADATAALDVVIGELDGAEAQFLGELLVPGVAALGDVQELLDLGSASRFDV
jgi:hypothetical protein